ncbi:probable phosphomevalonate kinase [Drosophila guanche]|uniref:Phosphomevalonate kinase n=1 Tax=Drosophila guanche TaxID=7266 RepID=A0A3B0JUY2_DROGU|nr:probable phosphomevalonate kinase [Drosophila guanche]SPP85917.1 blast:Probable phosphomevalonate kinase [Drosophila guanche]
MLKIVLISGKRKCGKDYISERLQKRLANRARIVRISEPIKSEWARKLQLDLSALLSDGPYKEQYRRDMIVWSDEMRTKDYGYFCRAAMAEAPLDQTPYIIVSDVRRKNDIKWFRETYGQDMVRTVRLTSRPETRQARGWTFTEGIDDVPSECDLDDYDSFDFVVPNEDENDQGFIDQLVDMLQLK